LGYLACDHFNADTGLALVRPDHQAFYRRVLLSETITEPRPFPSFSGSKNVVLMASDYRKVREKILTRFPIMRSSAFERRALFDRASARRSALRPVLDRRSQVRV
jgi:limonene-1,2-epoxide hydrolase